MSAKQQRDLLQEAVIALETFKRTMDRDLYRKEIDPIVTKIRDYLIDYDLSILKEKYSRRKKDPLDIDTQPQPLLPIHIKNSWDDTQP